jgi:hypothetical protein
LLAIVPEALVPANAAVACTKSDPRLDAIAVVMYGPILTEIPLLAMVPEALVPAKAAVAWTKSLPLLEAIAVVNPS